MKTRFLILLALALCHVPFAIAQSVPIKNAVLQGTLNGTPSGGTLDISALTFTANAPRFKTTLNLNNPANTFKYVITPAAILADRTLNLPLITGTDTLASLGLAQTWGGVQTFTTPVLGAATATSINGLRITTSTGTLTIANGKTATVSNTLTFTGTDASSVAFGTGGTVAYTANKLSAFAATTSAELATVLSDETGTGGGFVRATGSTMSISDATITSFLTLADSAQLVPENDGGTALGASGAGFVGLYLSHDAGIDFGDGTVVLIEDTGSLIMSAGDLRIQTAGTNAASVATLAGTQTLTNKTINGSNNTITNVPISTGISGLGTGVSVARLERSMFTTTATAAGTTTLTVTSAQTQEFTGTNTQIVKMPVVTTLTAGWPVRVQNKSTLFLVIQSSGGNVIAHLGPRATLDLVCRYTTADTTDAAWNYINDTFNHQSYAELNEDFIGGTNADGEIGSLGWRISSISGSNSTTYISSSTTHPGQFQFACGATSGNAGCLALAGSHVSVMQVSAYPFELRYTFKLNQTTLTRFRIGLANDDSAIVPNRSECLRYDTSLGDTNFKYVVCDGAGETATNALDVGGGALAADTNWHTLRIRTISATGGTYGMSISTSGSAYGTEVIVTNTFGGADRYVLAVIGNDATAAAKSFILDAVKGWIGCVR
tara:strand:- start:2117 stop:4105 length:1989 start_codon:yes stop_codon:yes gene_type:complete